MSARIRKIWRQGLLPVLAGLLLLTGCGQEAENIPQEIELHAQELAQWREAYHAYEQEIQSAEQQPVSDTAGTEAVQAAYDAKLYYDNTKSMAGFINSQGVESEGYRLIDAMVELLKKANYIRHDTSDAINAFTLGTRQSNNTLQWMQHDLNYIASNLRNEGLYTAVGVKGNLPRIRDEEGNVRIVGPLSMLFSNTEELDPSAVTVIVTDMLEQGFQGETMYNWLIECLENEGSEFGAAVLGASIEYQGSFTFPGHVGSMTAVDEITVENFEGVRPLFIIIMGPAKGVKQYYQDMAAGLEEIFGDNEEAVWGGIYCGNEQNKEATPPKSSTAAFPAVPRPLGSFQVMDALYDGASVSVQKKLQDICQILGSLNISGTNLTQIQESAEEEEAARTISYENAFQIKGRNLIPIGSNRFTVVSSLLLTDFDPAKQAVSYQEYVGAALEREEDGQQPVAVQDWIEEVQGEAGMTVYSVQAERIVFQSYDEESGTWKNCSEDQYSGILSAGLYQVTGPQEELGKLILGGGKSAAYFRAELDNGGILGPGHYYLSVPVTASVTPDGGQEETGGTDDSSVSKVQETGGGIKLLKAMCTTYDRLSAAAEQLTYLPEASTEAVAHYAWSRENTSPELEKALDMDNIVQWLKNWSDEAISEKNASASRTEVQQPAQTTKEYVQYIDLIITLE